MLQTTRGIVLRSVKYGETSLVCTVFTELYGVQAYIVQGIRSAKAKTQRSALLQPASLIDLTIYYRPNANLQRLREFSFAYVYTSLQEEIIKNSIALLSAELLLRLLPEQAPMPELFDFAFDCFCHLDNSPIADVANLPLYFILQCSRLLGYEIKGDYSEQTPYLNLHDGSFSAHPPASHPHLNDAETRILGQLLMTENIDNIKDVAMNATQRYHLIDWYLYFLQQHTQHLGSIKSLAVLRAVLH